MRGDVDQPDDLRIVADVGNDGAAVTVANQNGWTVLHVDDALYGGHVVAERGQRMLGYRHVVTVLGENVVDRLPAAAADPCTVHQHDVVHRRGGHRLARRASHAKNERGR